MITLALACAGACEASLLPESINGWKASAPARVWDRSNIFEYMDGAGELYLAYDFKNVTVREYTKPSAPRITAEVYLMTTPADAYGVYSHERGESGPTRIGQDRDYGYGLLRFWKNNYFIRIMADRETPESKAAVLALGKQISDEISGTGKRPQLLSELPKKNLIPRSVHYFHKHTVLNFHFYISDANILDLSEKTQAVIAQYQLKDSKPRLLIIRYPTPTAAMAAYKHFNKVYFKDKPMPSASSRVEEVEHGEYTGIKHSGKTLKLVFEAKTKAEVFSFEL